MFEIKLSIHTIQCIKVEVVDIDLDIAVLARSIMKEPALTDANGLASTHIQGKG